MSDGSFTRRDLLQRSAVGASSLALASGLSPSASVAGARKHHRRVSGREDGARRTSAIGRPAFSSPRSSCRRSRTGALTWPRCRPAGRSSCSAARYASATAASTSVSGALPAVLLTCGPGPSFPDGHRNPLGGMPEIGVYDTLPAMATTTVEDPTTVEVQHHTMLIGGESVDSDQRYELRETYGSRPIRGSRGFRSRRGIG
jgi:hypothetical protein